MSVVGILIAYSCLKAGSPAPEGNQGKHLSGVKGDVLATNLDRSVNPGEDFFAYANGGWLKRHPIPATESSWGIGSVIIEDLRLKLRSISEHPSVSEPKSGSDEMKVANFWSTAMNEAKAEELGITPLTAELDQIDAIASPNDVLEVAFQFQRKGIDTLFSFYVGQDEKKSDVMSVHLDQGGLGLPNRDFYFNKEAGVTKIRSEYVKHVATLLKLSGESEEAAHAAAGKIMEFETDLAKVSRKLEDLRDPIANYNKMTAESIRTKLTPSIDWNSHLSSWSLHPSYVIVGQPEFFSGLESLLKDTSVDVLKEYLKSHLINRYAAYLNKEAELEDFRFNHQVLSGQKEQRPRWKRVIDTESRVIGFILGRVFVKQYFPASAKKRYENLVEAFRVAYGHRIDRLDWMSKPTKAKAHQKLNSLIKKVGYPDKWKDYSKLVVGTNSYCENVKNASIWEFDDMVSKYGKPVDRTEWGMTPQTYNAYYNPSNNEIVLPATAFAIPGVKDSELDDAIIYGYAGASTIGHEMTHGFDDNGRQFDSKGNLAEWWTKEDAKKFKLRAQLMVKEFNAYQPLPGLHVNGKASLGENIADYGGLLLGIDAFKKTEQYKKGKKIAGLTPMQRFFLAYALSWLDQQRPEILRQQLLSDVHTPAKWRVLGPLSNIPEFYKAFHVKPGQSMWRPASGRVNIW